MTEINRTAEERADQLATDIERYAAFIRANPDIAARIGTHRFLICLANDDARTAMADIARRARRAGAEMAKEVTDTFASALLRFGRITLDVYAPRDEVCERVVTGTREVEVEEKDPEALAKVPTVKKTVVVEDVEWECKPLLAADEPAVAVAS